MPLYNASQVIGKTIALKYVTKIYKVFDVNNLGDKASPCDTYQAGRTVIIDSYLEATPGYTSAYGIKYAKRSYPYYTFYSGGVYLCFKDDGNVINKDYLKEQGAKSVVEEMEEQRRANLSWIERLMEDIGKFAKPVLITVIVIAAIYFTLPLILEYTRKNKK